jgi:hypothetical protein
MLMIRCDKELLSLIEKSNETNLFYNLFYATHDKSKINDKNTISNL